MARISKRSVDAANPGDKPHFLWDDRLSGFGLLTLPSGVKSYVFQFRNQHGRTGRVTIGRHGDWTPDEARRKADELRAAVKAGRDPMAEKREAREALTVRELLELYRASDSYKAKTPDRQSVDRSRIVRHLEPTIGSKVVDSLRREDLIKAMAAIRTGRTAVTVRTGKLRGLAIVKGGEGPAQESIKLLRTIMNWGIAEKLITENAARSIKRAPQKHREAIIEDGAGYQRLFATLAKLEEEHRLTPAGADIIRLLALTGARRSEIAGLRWVDVDLKLGVIVLPAERHKSGKASGQLRTIALPVAAQAILSRQPAGAANALVFPPSKGQGLIALSRLWRLVRVEAGFPADLVLHSLRHSFGSHLAMSGASGPELMSALGHAQITTTLRYSHFQQTARIALAERGAAVALAGMAAAEGKTAAEVVSLPRKGR